MKRPLLINFPSTNSEANLHKTGESFSGLELNIVINEKFSNPNYMQHKKLSIDSYDQIKNNSLVFQHKCEIQIHFDDGSIRQSDLSLILPRQLSLNDLKEWVDNCAKAFLKEIYQNGFDKLPREIECSLSIDSCPVHSTRLEDIEIVLFLNKKRNFCSVN